MLKLVKSNIENSSWNFSQLFQPVLIYHLSERYCFLSSFNTVFTVSHVSLSLFTTSMQNMQSDVICKNLRYGGTNIEDPGQTPRIMRGIWSGPTILVAHEQLQWTFLLLPVKFQPLIVPETCEISWSRRPMFVPP